MADDTDGSMLRRRRQNELHALLTVDEDEAKLWGTRGQPGLYGYEGGSYTGDLLDPNNPYNVVQGGINLRRMGYDLSAVPGGPDMAIVNRYRGQTRFDPEYGWLAPEQAAIDMTSAQARRNAAEFDIGKAGVAALASGGLGLTLGPAITGLTGNPFADTALKNALTGAVKTGISGGNPLQGALGGAATGGLGSLLKGFNASPFDLSNAGTGATLTSVNPLADLQGGNMDFFDSFSNFNPFESVNPLDQMTFGGGGGLDFSSNPLFSGFMDGAGPLAFNPLSAGSGLFGEAAAGLSGLGGLSNISQYLKTLTGTGATGGGAGGSGGGGGLPRWLTGSGGLDGLFGEGGLLGLGARLAPGMGALALAQSQGSVDTSPLSNLLNNGASTFNSPLDTSRLSSLFGQVGDMTGRNTASALRNFDTRTGQARGDLLSGLERRGVMGSSFGNMDIGNFDTQSQNQRGLLEGQLGLQGLAAQTGLANNMLGAEQAQRQQQLGYLANQAAVADALLRNQVAQKKVQSDLFGRSFDLMGSALSPTLRRY